MYNKYQLQWYKSRRRFLAALIFFIAVSAFNGFYQPINPYAFGALGLLLIGTLIHTWLMTDFYLDCWIEDVLPNSTVMTPCDKRVDREWAAYQKKRGK